MATQTYMKRQKEMARQQKQRDKAIRREQRKAEKKPGGPPLEGEELIRLTVSFPPSAATGKLLGLVLPRFVNAVISSNANGVFDSVEL